MDTNVIGIIPTRVGTSILFAPLLLNSQDHPHACGDKLHSVIKSFMLLGSSPRVWGQVWRCRSFHTLRRIIPTRVGTSVHRC